jgi:uncharacterized membrane protein YoaK (UPF0700 family)
VRPGERDVLLFLLAIGAGAADGWSYVGLGHAFVANMTGNTVLIGLAVFDPHGDWLHRLMALAGYVVGTALAARLAGRTGPDAIWTKSISWILLLEAIVLAGAAIAWAVLRTAGGFDPSWTNPLLASVAFAIGLQSGAMLPLKIPGIVTTYITGTWTTMLSGVVKLFSAGHPENPRQKLRYEERLLMQGGILVAYFLSAVLSGWAFRYAPPGAGVLPAAAVFPVAIYGLIRG